MQLRKERTHRCGYTNIDFRSKKDTEALKTYQPWVCAKSFGTMGYSDFKLTTNDHKKLLEPTNPINTHRVVRSELPDPKYHKTALYYSTNKIPIRKKTFYTDERVAQLDESFKGKDKYTGDSMMIAEVTKLRKHKTKFIDDIARIHKSNII
jgi:hypothetical protein